MKYINKREDFLKKSKHDKIGKLIKEEAGGPFTNDIPWGDSLVGRLINAIVRKSGIAINVTRIKKLIPRLKELFDEILEDSKLSKESQVKVWKLKVFALLQKLKKAVDNEEEINVLVYITDDLITIVDSDYIDDENRKKLLDELKKFKEFLLSLKDESPEEEKEEEQEEEEKEEVKPVSTNTQEIPFDFCIKNLKAVYAILVAYRKLKDANKQEHITKKDSTGQEVEVGKEYTYNNIKVKVIDLRNPKKYGGDKEWLTGDDTLGTGTMADDKVYVVDISKDKPGNTGYPAVVNKLKPITESTTPVVAAPAVTTPAVAPKQNSILNAIKPVYTYFTSDKDIFSGLESLFKMSPENQQKYGFKAPILKIYNTARLNEDLKQFLTRPEAIGKSLITMYKSTKVKEDGSFEGIQDDMKLAIADFNKTMKSILLFQSGVAEKPKKEGEVETKTETKPVETQTKKEDDIDFDNKNRSDFSDSVKLLKYNSFMRINEADEATPTTQAQSEPVQGTQSQTQGQSQVQGTQSQSSDAQTNAQKIKDYFEKNVNYNVWAVELSEVKRIDSEIEKESKDNTELIINGIDPIIEILKLFNRAYKLHTTNNIPGGRSGGAVSRSVYNEYTPFGGSGSGQSGISDGPYRNNKIFNVWENAVLDIMKERKYQPIFSKETKIRIGNELVKGAGSTFKKLITNLLDTEKLYNSGAQKKFLDEYFGPNAVPEGTSLGLPGDEKANADNSGNIKTIEYKFTAKTESIDFLSNTKILIGKLFEIKSKDKTIYMLVESTDGTFTYVSYCQSFKKFSDYIGLQKGPKTEINPKPTNMENLELRYTKFNNQVFNQFLNQNRNIELKSVFGSENKTEQTKVEVITLNLLTNSDDNSLFTLKDHKEKDKDFFSKKYGDDNTFDITSKVVV
jgi:hypothetical protein